MLPNLCLQDVNKLRLHELVVVGDAKADHTLAAKLPPEVVRELALVLLLHDEDDFGPLDQFRGERVVGATVRTRRRRFETRSAGENLLGGGAAEAVLAADEEEAQG